MSVGATPAYKQSVGIGITLHFHIGNVAGDEVDFLLTGLHHFLVVGRVGRDGTCVVVLLKSAKAVLESGSAGDSPVAHLSFLIAHVWAPALLEHFGLHEVGFYCRVFIFFGYAPS